MHGYKYAMDDFAKTIGGAITQSGNGVRVLHPFDQSRFCIIYPNRDTQSKVAFFVQMDEEEAAQLQSHFGEILAEAKIDARQTEFGAYIAHITQGPETEQEIGAYETLKEAVHGVQETAETLA